MNGLYFIIGANGVGKTTLVQKLKNALVHKPFSIHDFDERGVPDNADKAWRESEVRHWITVGKDNATQTQSTIVCGFIKPEEVREAAVELSAPVHVVLLDANEESIKQRIMNRYLRPESHAELERTTGKTPDKFALDSAWTAGRIRESAKELGYEVVDTTSLSPQEVEFKVIEFILSTLVPKD